MIRRLLQRALAVVLVAGGIVALPGAPASAAEDCDAVAGKSCVNNQSSYKAIWGDTWCLAPKVIDYESYSGCSPEVVFTTLQPGATSGYNQDVDAVMMDGNCTTTTEYGGDSGDSTSHSPISWNRQGQASQWVKFHGQDEIHIRSKTCYPPGGFNAITVTSNSITLDWDDIPVGQGRSTIKYHIFRGSGAGTHIGRANQGTHNYTDSGLAANTQYCYRITMERYWDGALYLESQQSAPLCLYTSQPPPPPTNFCVSPCWVSTFANAPGYPNVYSQTPNGTLYAGYNYVYCKIWGPQVGSGGSYNSWWLKTDLDTGSTWQNQWVSAYYLSLWGNNEAFDNNHLEIPDCT